MEIHSKSSIIKPFSDLTGYRIWKLENDYNWFGDEPLWMYMMRECLWDCLHEFLATCDNDAILNERDCNNQGWGHLYVLNDINGVGVAVFIMGLSRLGANWNDPDIFGKTIIQYNPSTLVAQSIVWKAWSSNLLTNNNFLKNNSKVRPDINRIMDFWVPGKTNKE